MPDACSPRPWRLFLLATLVIAGCGSPPAGPPPGPGGAPPAVTVAKPLVLPTLEWDPYTGRLTAIDQVEVRARVSGYLVSHHFEEGQPVKRGQLLFTIDPRPYEAAVAQARASREEAVAKRAEAVAQIAAAEAMREQATARIELTRAQLRRARPLVPSGAISEDELDEYVNSARQAEADGLAADAQIEASKAAETAAAAAIVTAEAALRTAELDLGYCRITAPISGRIGRRSMTEGNLVSGGLGSTTLTTIVSTDPIHADFDAGEQALLKYIRLDRDHKRASSRDVKTPVYMALADETGYPHQGYIDFVDNQVDRSTGSIRARAIFPNPDETLIPGVFVKVQVPGSAPEPRVLIPDSAVATDQASKIVYVVGAEGKLEPRPVVLGPIIKGLRVVREGLTGDESIVTRGLQRCRPGIAVAATEEALQADDSDGLPDTYKPVPPEEWLVKPATAAGGEATPQ